MPARLGLARSSDTIKVARLANETGLFPVFEAEHGVVTDGLADPPPRAGRGVPVDPDALRATSSASPARPDIVARIQEIADHNIATLRTLLDDGERAREVTAEEAALRHHARRRIEPREPDRLVARRATRLRRPTAALQQRLPGRGEHPGWLYDAETGDYEAAWRRLVEDNPFPAIMGRVCFHPCETACNRAQVDEAVGINAVERFLGDLAIERGWALPDRRPRHRQARSRRRRGPAGLQRAYHLRRLGHQVRLVDSAPTRSAA